MNSSPSLVKTDKILDFNDFVDLILKEKLSDEFLIRFLEKFKVHVQESSLIAKLLTYYEKIKLLEDVAIKFKSNELIFEAIVYAIKIDQIKVLLYFLKDSALIEEYKDRILEELIMSLQQYSDVDVR